MLNHIFPLFNTFQAWLSSIIPYSGSISVWGTIAGIFAMVFYSITSNQSVISKLKIQSQDIRRQMMDPSIEDHTEFNTLAMKNLKFSLTLLGKVFAPATFSAIPVLFVAAWLDIYQGYALPEEQQEIEITVFPIESNIDITPPEIVLNKTKHLSISPLHTGNISFYSNNRLVYSGNPFVLPAPVITKKQWWNKLLAAEAGYLLSDTSIQSIRMDFPRKKVLDIDGIPNWTKGWEFTFFLSVMIAALLIKFIFKIH